MSQLPNPSACLANHQCCVTATPETAWEASTHSAASCSHPSYPHPPCPLTRQVNGRILYADERPEWQMEKYRFYVELPGDVWEDGYFMQLIKMNQVRAHRRGMPCSTAAHERWEGK